MPELRKLYSASEWRVWSPVFELRIKHLSKLQKNSSSLNYLYLLWKTTEVNEMIRFLFGLLLGWTVCYHRHKISKWLEMLKR